MTEHIHTYTDPEGDSLRVGKGVIRVGKGIIACFGGGGQDAAVFTPTGEDAVALARAILAAAGDTGHRVVPEDWLIAETTMQQHEETRLAHLETEVRELRAAQERLDGLAEFQGAQMRSAQAAIRGVGDALEEHVEAHLAHTSDLEARLRKLET